jgi:hypothetical protein
MATTVEPPIDDPCADSRNRKALEIEYRDIAWWAESADGFRNRQLVVARYVEDGETKYKLEPEDDANDMGHKILIGGIYVGSCRPDRPAVTRILIEVGGKTKECTVEGATCDAIFCTESAMRKFLFPYYHSQRLLTREQWATLHSAFNDETVAAIGHVAPSHSGTVGTDGDGAFLIAQATLSEERKPTDFAWLTIAQYRKKLTAPDEGP